MRRPSRTRCLLSCCYFLNLKAWLGTRELPVNSALYASVIINKWEVANPNAIVPPATAFHAAVAVKNCLVVFGGLGGAPFATGFAFGSALSAYLVNTVCDLHDQIILLLFVARAPSLTFFVSCA